MATHGIMSGWWQLVSLHDAMRWFSFYSTFFRWYGFLEFTVTILSPFLIILTLFTSISVARIACILIHFTVFMKSVIIANIICYTSLFTLYTYPPFLNHFIPKIIPYLWALKPATIHQNSATLICKGSLEFIFIPAFAVLWNGLILNVKDRSWL